MASLE
jgi:predicted ATP-dependent serine protease